MTVYYVSLLIYCGFITRNALCYNGTLCTVQRCLIKDSSVRFFHIGDWGGQDRPPYVTQIQKTVAAGMKRIHKKHNVHFVISPGDHFYFKGPKSVTDIRFKKTFDDTYTFGKKDIPWYFVGGNHDYYGDIRSQLNYSRVNSRWVYPDLFYVLRYQLSSSNTTIDLIMIDTIVLCGGTWPGGYNPETRKNERPYDLPKGPKDVKKAELWWLWLQDRLARSKADYLLVVGHYPIFSSGYHGDFTCPGARMQNLFEKYNVTAYLCAHDHNLQYVKSRSSKGWIIHHILSGGGSKLDKRKRWFPNRGSNSTNEFFFPDPSTRRRQELTAGGFVQGEFHHRRGSFSFYSGTGALLYKVNVVSRQSHYASNETVGIDYYKIARNRYCPKIRKVNKYLFYSSSWFPSWYVFGDLSPGLLPDSIRDTLCV